VLTVNFWKAELPALVKANCVLLGPGGGKHPITKAGS
jgi:hypothetical protein